MKKKLCCFFGFLFLLIGLQMSLTDRFFLTSQCTRAIALRQDPSISKKERLYMAFWGEEVPFPEKEVVVSKQASYITMFLASICLMHSVVIKK